ncbi:MAG: hypothetical protein VKO65_03625 [Cyanobacteriota bacterium]|nr:hypothetical protein [Cyanobacteriota bacterium]
MQKQWNVRIGAGIINNQQFSDCRIKLRLEQRFEAGAHQLSSIVNRQDDGQTLIGRCVSIGAMIEASVMRVIARVMVWRHPLIMTSGRFIGSLPPQPRQHLSTEKRPETSRLNNKSR